MSKYAEIIERLDKATKESRSIDGDIAEAIGEVPKKFTKRSIRQPDLWSDGGPGLRAQNWIAPQYTSSVDAAITLLNRELPGWEWVVGSDGSMFGGGVSQNIGAPDFEGFSKASAPIAILLAIFRALEAREVAA